MTAYLRAWWFGTTTTGEELDCKADDSSDTPSHESTLISSTSTPDVSPAEPPVTVSISTPEETEEALEEPRTEQIEVVDNDIPPAFPSLNSIQRSSASLGPSRTKAPTRADKELMPPPTLPTWATPLSRDINSSSSSRSSIAKNEITVSSPLPPPTSNTLRIPSASGTSSNTLKLPPTTTRVPKRRGQVALAPGHSPLDWAALKGSGQDLRGTSSLMRISSSQLKMHKSREDAWTAVNGKVYNITPYLSFHPGGEKEIMRVAGRDGTRLFGLTHPWVNADVMLDECMVGFLVPEPSSAA